MIDITEKFDRNKGIGGSDIPALLGLSKWKTPLALYLEKTGTADAKDFLYEEKFNHILNMGKMLEPYVIDCFEKETGKTITRKQERVHHPKYNFLWATLDGMLDNKVFEVKTTSSFVRAWDEGIPPYVLAQVAFYCSLLDSDGAKIIVLFRDTGEIRSYEYQRNLEKEDEILKYALDFWNSVCKRIPPMPFDYADAQLLFKDVVSDKKIMASMEDIEAVSKMIKLKNEIKERESEFEMLKTSICSKIGDASSIEDSLGECLVTWKERITNRFSTEILKKTFPNIYSQCLLKGTTRMFNLKNRDQYNTLMGRY